MTAIGRVVVDCFTLEAKQVARKELGLFDLPSHNLFKGLARIPDGEWGMFHAYVPEPHGTKLFCNVTSRTGVDLGSFQTQVPEKVSIVSERLTHFFKPDTWFASGLNDSVMQPLQQHLSPMWDGVTTLISTHLGHATSLIG
jgi:hypothetical protein